MYMKKFFAWLQFHNKGKILFILLILTVALIITGIYCVNYFKTVNLKPEQVFVCDNPKHDSEFDKWLKEDLGLDWVPTYLVIQDKQVIGMIRGGVSEKEFSAQLGTVLANPVSGYPVTDLEISNLLGERKAFSSLFTDELSFVEISWAQCPDCIEQDKKFTNSIYKKYGTDIFIRYYIKTETTEVEQKYI